MQDVFRAEAIAADVVERDQRRLSITLSDGAGRETTVSLTPEVAAALARIAGEFAPHGGTGEPAPAKMPSAFAIGSGRFEPVVLIRFEDDVPYGLSADHAMRLGRALIAEAKQMTSQPPGLRQ